MSEPLDAQTLGRLAVTTAWSKRPRRADMACVATHEIAIDLRTGARTVETRLPAGVTRKERPPRPIVRCAGCCVAIPNARDYQKYCTRQCYLASRKSEERHNGGPPPDRVMMQPVMRIQAIVCSVWKVPLDTMTMPGRARCYAWPRQAAISLCMRHVPETSRPQIGRLFGGRDNSTVINAQRVTAYRLAVPGKDNAEFTERYRRAEALILTGGNRSELDGR